MLIKLIAVTLGGICVAVADAAIKRAVTDAGGTAAKLLWLLAAGLYVAQAAFFAFVFRRRLELGIAGTLQMTAYSISTVAIGLVVFRERLVPSQVFGIVLAMIACIMIVRQG
jgi:drug/metabolite transporter (DMT)-like permease